MSREGHIYKLWCDGVDEFYIGSSFYIRDRKVEHKYNCKNITSPFYNLKVYKYIRDNKGFDNWKFEILETALFENKTALRIREQHYIKTLNSNLNASKAYQTKEEQQEYRKQHNQKRKNIKINCPCGSITNKPSKPRHERTDKHQKYLQNITINITNLNITI